MLPSFMSGSVVRRLIAYGTMSATVLSMAVGCGEETGPNETPAIGLTLSPNAASVEQGGSAPVAVTVTGTGGFTGSATVAVQGAPAGVTGTVSDVQTTSGVTTATITIEVGASVVPDVYDLTVRGSGSSVSDATASFALTVTAAPAYTMALTPDAVSVEQGTSGTSVVTLTRTNFTGAVTLSLGNAPAGVTAAFDPAAPTGTNSTVTVTVGAAVTPGVYNLTVDGTGSAGNRSAPLTLTVTATPDYALSLEPAALSVEQGTSGTSVVTLTRTNFTGAVTLSLSNAPAGVTAAFHPAAPTGTTSTVTVSVGAAVTPGVYNLTVDGTGTAGSRSTPLTLTVTAAPASYTMALTPDAVSIEQGTTGTSVVTLTRTNFTGAVTLLLGNAPAGVTAAFDPAAPTGTTSTVTVTVGAAVTTGVYNLTVDGTGSAGNRSTPLTLTVTATPDYAVSLEPAALSVEQGTTGTSVVTLTRTNFTGAVTLSLSNAPAGVTAAFDPAAPTGTTSTVTVTVGAAVTPGVYNLTVDGTGSAGNRSTPLALTVTAAPESYTLALTPAELSVVQGENGTSDVTITRVNFTGTVTLSLGNAPAGVTAAFDPAAPTGTTSTVTVTVGAAVTPGVYNLTVDGTGSAGNRSTPLTLTVTATPDYAVSLEPAALSVEQGTTGTSVVTLTRTNFTGAVTLSLSNAPAGVTAAFDPAAPTGTTSTVTVTVGAAVTPGVYNLTVDGTGSAGNRNTPLTLTVTATGYTLSMTPSSVSVAQGGNTSSTINITRTAGFSQTVALTVTGVPAGLTAVPTPSSTSGNSSSLEITASAGLTPDSYTLTVHGNSTGLPEETTTLGVTVAASGGGNVTVDFSACAVADRPVWVAFQDGTGAWNQVVGSNDSYMFSITQTKGGLAYVTLDNGTPLVLVQYRAQGEMTGSPVQLCDAPGTKTVNGTLAGLGIGEWGSIALGGGAATAFGNGSFQITSVNDGSFDLVAYKSAVAEPGTGARMLLRRDQDIVSGGTVGTVDFAGTEAFDPASGTITLNGLAGGETMFANMNYLTATAASACQAATLYNGFAPGSASFAAYGAPGGQQNADDFHQIFINASGTNGLRTVSEYFHTMGARTLTLGEDIPTPTITTLGGPYKRLQSSLTMPSDYASWASFSYVSSATDKSVSIFATAGWLGGLSVTLGLDDFSGVSGWDNSWAPAVAEATDYLVSGTGATGSACTEGARTLSATRIGSN